VKIAITGHTSGIGLGLYNYFSKDHDVLGFSRSVGYDISNIGDRQRILEASKGCEIFVNNAYNNYDDSQLEMLKMVVDSSDHRGCFILNMSTRWTNADNKYCITKKNMDLYCDSLMFNRDIKLLNIKPGLIDTPRVENETGNKMTVQDIVRVMEFAMTNQDRFNIHSICFGK
jgi:short-subunit dehydrogenase involved in D-alanine esterification of teichoic acids